MVQDWKGGKTQSMMIGMSNARVTITLPRELVREIDQRERNRSKFIQAAVRRELAERRRQELLSSLSNPHPESQALADQGLEAWQDRASPEDEQLLDPDAGTEVRWLRGEGWFEGGD